MELTKEMHGKRISCTIKNQDIKEAIVYWESGTFYILQNSCWGSNPNKKHEFVEFNASWSVNSGSAQKLKENSVKNIVFLNQIHELWT